VSNQNEEQQIIFDIPYKAGTIFDTNKRYIIFYGGRGSAKSWSVAAFLILKAVSGKFRILCVREVQNSIKDSVHKLLCDTIERLGFEHLFVIQKDSIKSNTGSEIIFKGLWNNEKDIKSTEGIDYCWGEESEALSKKSLITLVPTIRKKGSKIIFSYNPTDENDAVHVDYTVATQKGLRDDCELIEMNFEDNPYFTEELRAEMEYDKRVDYDKYLHVWRGQTVAHSEAQIFHGKWEIKDFETPEGVELLYGGDWGGGPDPMAVVRCFVKDSCLYIDQEVYGCGVNIDDYVSFYDRMPGVRKHKITADKSRPESIRHLSDKGFFIVPAKQEKGSVDDGIARLRRFEKIYVHSRCKNTAYEFRYYCWKVDKRTGVISNIPNDKHNHIIDSIRYATEDYDITDTLADFAEAFAHY